MRLNVHFSRVRHGAKHRELGGIAELADDRVDVVHEQSRCSLDLLVEKPRGEAEASLRHSSPEDLARRLPVERADPAKVGDRPVALVRGHPLLPKQARHRVHSDRCTMKP